MQSEILGNAEGERWSSPAAARPWPMWGRQARPAAPAARTGQETAAILDDLHVTSPSSKTIRDQVFSSRFSSLRKRQSVPSAMIFCGLDLIMPVSCMRSA